MTARIESSDGISRKFVIRDEDGSKIATLKMTVEFTDLLDESQLNKLPDFLSVTGDSFKLMLDC